MNGTVLKPPCFLFSPKSSSPCHRLLASSSNIPARCEAARDPDQRSLPRRWIREKERKKRKLNIDISELTPPLLPL